MPIVLFQAEQKVPGHVYQFVVAGSNFTAIQTFVGTLKIGAPGIRYKPFVVQDGPQIQATLLCTETLAAAIAAPGPQGMNGLETQAVAVPIPSRDRSGFEGLDNLAPSEGDDVFGDGKGDQGMIDALATPPVSGPQPMGNLPRGTP